MMMVNTMAVYTFFDRPFKIALPFVFAVSDHHLFLHRFVVEVHRHAHIMIRCDRYFRRFLTDAHQVECACTVELLHVRRVAVNG